MALDRTTRGPKPKIEGERPGYRTVLPRVFPYKREMSREDAVSCVLSLEEAGRVDYAVTGHAFTVDGHVTLWLSVENAELLTRLGNLAYVETTVIGARR